MLVIQCFYITAVFEYNVTIAKKIKKLLTVSLCVIIASPLKALHAQQYSVVLIQVGFNQYK